MNRIIISLVVLVVFTVMAIPIFGGGKRRSNIKVVDANGLVLGKVVGMASAGAEAQVATTVGGELVILRVSRVFISGTELVSFKVDNCAGQGFLPSSTTRFMITGVGGVDNSVYKVLDRNPALLESFTTESILLFGGCDDVSFAESSMLPATRLGDLSEFTLPLKLK